MRKIEIFYPSFTRKALTFTIDDGNMTYDERLIEILAPAGIRGTFNLCSNIHKGREAKTVEFYSGYDVANHCKHHPLVNFDGVEYVLSDGAFDEATAEAKFNKWLGEKEAKIAAKSGKIAADKVAAHKAAVAEEIKTKEAIAAKIAEKKAAAAAAAAEAAAEENAEEAATEEA